MARTATVDLKLAKGGLSETAVSLLREVDRSSDPIKQVVKQIFLLPEIVKELVTIERDVRTTGAYEVVIRLDPSDCFTSILSAVRAGDVNFLIVEHGRLRVKLGE